MAAAAIVDFQNFKFLTARTLEIELRRSAKFCQSWSNHGGDMTFFSIFQHGGGRHLKYFKFQTVVAVERVELRHGGIVKCIVVKFQILHYFYIPFFDRHVADFIFL